jgi:hypothetical protein
LARVSLRQRQNCLAAGRETRQSVRLRVMNGGRTISGRDKFPGLRTIKGFGGGCGRINVSGLVGGDAEIAPFLQHNIRRPLQRQRSSAKVVSLLMGSILPPGTIPHPAVSKIGVTNPISEAGHV